MAAEGTAVSTNEYMPMTVYGKLARVRTRLMAGGMHRSGMHRHKNKNTGALVEYKYFELSDFLPLANKLFDEVGLCSVFKTGTSYDENGKPFRWAQLDIVNSDRPVEKITFESEAELPDMGTGIQSLGAMHTYMRRYLWLEALEIVEHDAVDAEELSPSDIAELLNEFNEIDNQLRTVGVDRHDRAFIDWVATQAKTDIDTLDPIFLTSDVKRMKKIMTAMKKAIKVKGGKG